MSDKPVTDAFRSLSIKVVPLSRLRKNTEVQPGQSAQPSQADERSTRPRRFGRFRVLTDRNLVILLMILGPVVTLATLDPDSFVAGWNEGRGGLLFAVFFAVIEWYDLRSRPILMNRKLKSTWAVSLTALAAYYSAVSVLGLREALEEVGRTCGLPDMPSMFSWISALEFTVFGLYVFAIFASSYGIAGLRSYLTPIAYLFGMAFIFILDAAFPYGQLGPLQAIVLALVPPVVFLLTLLGVATVWQPAAARLYIYQRSNGTLIPRGALDFYWPCVGVHSMIIFLLIIIVLVAKLEAPRSRKIVYALVGALGTVLTNVIRIFAISFYLAIYGVEKAKAFHEMAGEVIFLIWVILFLLSTVKIEDWLIARTLKQGTGITDIQAEHPKPDPHGAPKAMI